MNAYPIQNVAVTADERDKFIHTYNALVDTLYRRRDKIERIRDKLNGLRYGSVMVKFPPHVRLRYELLVAEALNILADIWVDADDAGYEARQYLQGHPLMRGDTVDVMENFRNQIIYLTRAIPSVLSKLAERARSLEIPQQDAMPFLAQLAAVRDELDG